MYTAGSMRLSTLVLLYFSRKKAFEQQVTEECISHTKNIYRQKENKGERLRFVLSLMTQQGGYEVGDMAGDTRLSESW